MFSLVCVLFLQNQLMAVHKPVLELKDVPPPPPHSSAPQPLTLPRPCPHPPQDSWSPHHGSLTVSVCSCCKASIGQQQDSITGGGFPLYLSHSQTDTRTALHLSSLAQRGSGTPLQTPGSFERPSTAPCCHVTCCSGARQPQVCPSLSKVTGVCRCSRDPRVQQQRPFSHGDPSSPTHLCPGALHVTAERTPFGVKGARCFHDCWRKVGGAPSVTFPAFCTEMKREGTERDAGCGKTFSCLS